MKAVLISIQPKHCELIASGKKTIEVRKTRPKLETPFKCYIYETNWKDNSYWKQHHKDKLGKVIGEFVCDDIIGTCTWRLKGETGFCAKRTEKETKLPDRACLTLKEIEQYAGHIGRGVYGWHISELKIYDEPKELSEFYRECKGVCVNTAKKILCLKTKMLKTLGGCDRKIPLERPPQSWCYVESLGE